MLIHMVGIRNIQNMNMINTILTDIRVVDTQAADIQVVDTIASDMTIISRLIKKNLTLKIRQQYFLMKAILLMQLIK